MYAGQLETIRSCWVADMSVAVQFAGFCLASGTPNSFSDARLPTAKKRLPHPP
jgi:hypothetical protein